MDEKEKIKQFWNYKIHPITGYATSSTDKYSNKERLEMRKTSNIRKTSNKQ